MLYFWLQFGTGHSTVGSNGLGRTCGGSSVSVVLLRLAAGGEALSTLSIVDNVSLSFRRLDFYTLVIVIFLGGLEQLTLLTGCNPSIAKA